MSPSQNSRVIRLEKVTCLLASLGLIEALQRHFDFPGLGVGSGGNGVFVALLFGVGTLAVVVGEFADAGA